MLGLLHNRHTSVLEGNMNKAATIFWNACMKIEEKQDVRLKASDDTDIVKRCRQALSCWNEKVMCVLVCRVGWGGALGGGGLLWVMAPVWQGSDRYVIMLTTIFPPIVLPETNLLKIHPVPSSPSSANSLQREWGWRDRKRKETEKVGMNTRNSHFFGVALQNSYSYCGIKCWFAVIGEPFLSLCSILSGTHLLVICYGRFAAQWNLSGSGVISLLQHWLLINEAILANAFWHLWNYFWNGVFGHTIHKRLVSFKVNSLR